MLECRKCDLKEIKKKQKKTQCYKFEGFLTDSQFGLGAVQCCHVHPAGFPWKRTGWGLASSRKQQEQNPGDRSPPPSTSPAAGRRGNNIKLC